MGISNTYSWICTLDASPLWSISKSQFLLLLFRGVLYAGDGRVNINIPFLRHVKTTDHLQLQLPLQ